MKFIGAHVSAQGGVDQAPLNAAAIGARAFGLFVKNQRQWEAKPLSIATRDAFAANLKQQDFDAAHILPHAGYLINLANPDPTAHARSVASLVNEMERCVELGLHLINLHPGSHLKQCSPAEGVANVVRATREVIAAVPGMVVVFENTAGQGGSLGANFEELAAIIAGVGQPERIGICLDTAHLYAAGFDIAAEGGYAAMMQQFDERVGMQYLRAMHLNDTKIECGRRVDRHAVLGAGHLGWETLTQVVRDPRTDAIPLILETPDEEGWAAEIARLYELAET